MSGNKIHKTHFTQPEMPWRKNKEETVELNMKTKTCSKCGMDLPLSEFYFYGGDRKEKLRADCKECVKNKNLDYYYRDHEASILRHRRWRERNRDATNARARTLYRRWRESALNAYGKVCACCGESEPMFLEIDHVNNDGAEHRKKIGTSARALVKWLVDNNYPDGFQILCANCNQGKKRNGGICPHKTKNL